MNTRHPNRFNRRGAAAASTLAIIIPSGALVVVSVAIVPGALRADSDAQTTIEQPPTNPDHAQALDAVTILLEQSHALIAHHPRLDDTRPARTVVWYEDANQDNTPAVGEILVLTHYPTTGTLAATIYNDNSTKQTTPQHTSATDNLILSTLTPRSFADRWAYRPDVKSTVIATGLDDFRFDPPAQDQSTPVYRITLRWNPKQTDSPDGRPIAPDVGVVSLPMHLATETPLDGAAR